MALDRILFVKVYLNRLVNSLVPSEFGSEYTNSLVNDLLVQLSGESTSTSDSSLSHSLNQVKTLLLSQNRNSDWLRLRQIVDLLAQEKSLDQVSRYLVFLSEFLPEQPQQAQQPSRTAFSPSNSSQIHMLPPTNIMSSPGANASHFTGQPLAKLIEPYWRSLTEAQIIPFLQFTLLGQDTKLLAFLPLDDAIEIPPSIDNTHARLLSDILETALIFRRLTKFSEESRGVDTSPIKVSFFRCVESLLNRHAAFINQLFQSQPTSLIAIYNSLKQQTKLLRTVLYLQRQSQALDGFQFLMKVQNLSKFGDSTISNLASDIFESIVVPYYEYIEQWIIRGELIDEYGDFFVSFNASENHINDIVKYDNKKLPTFLNMESSVFEKILQIGKTLIFLAKFCKELDWVNNYSAHYSNQLFQANEGLRSMSTSAIQDIIFSQHREVLNYFTVVIQGKFLIFSHLVNLKGIMLMNNNDFIDTINDKGAEMFGEPARSLTSGRLSDLLSQSIEGSTIRSLPSQYLNLIDARILDLSHGSIGWDVFTLEYKYLELPVEVLLNYNNASTQYLRLFHFLWSLRHYQYLLNDNFLEFQSLQKHELQSLGPQKAGRRRIRNKHEETGRWFLKAVRTINIVRSKLLAVIHVLLKFLSFDLIEEQFNEKIIKTLFKPKSALGANLTNTGKGQALPILKQAFAKKFQHMSGQDAETQSLTNMNACSIDDITSIHAKYLDTISRCKLLHEDAKGRISGRRLIDQIFDFLDLTFAFVKSSGEFGASLVNYINILNLKLAAGESVTDEDDNGEFDNDLTQLTGRLRALMKIIYTDIYVGKFEPQMDVFLKDLRSDVELKELSKLF